MLIRFAPFAFLPSLLFAACTATADDLPRADDWQPDWIYLQDGTAGEQDAPRVARWLDDELLADGWIQLDNDNSLFGWTATNDNKWTTCNSKGFVCTNGELGWLMTTTEWTDFELVVDFRCHTPDANSGVFIRSAAVPTDPAQDCYEINIAPPSNPYPTGSIVDRQRAEYTQEQLDELNKNSKTHRLHIIATGPRIQVKLDGQLVTDFVDTSDLPLLKGHIGLQFNEGIVVFRRVLLKPLATKPIFNGTDLTGWRTDLAGDARFSVTDEGALQVLGGPGQAESIIACGDFVLQFDCKVNGDGANSGVFFRSIPGDKMNGYECQVQNSYLEGDRTKPKDCGTGGIYRRTNARLVNAEDHKWFSTTVHADGPHIATWVNGLQVVDWTDSRPADDNPRRGLRLEPGTFCLQAHDPTTNLLFRNLRVQEMLPQEIGE